jgi:hypothetical protein
LLFHNRYDADYIASVDIRHREIADRAGAAAFVLESVVTAGYHARAVIVI